MSSISQEESIYVTLFSNESMNIYKNNSNTFTNLLKQPLNLNDQWVVGLTDISFCMIDKHKKNKQNVVNKRGKRNLESKSMVYKEQNNPKINLKQDHEDVKNKFRKLMGSTLNEQAISNNSENELKITSVDKKENKSMDSDQIIKTQESKNIYPKSVNKPELLSNINKLTTTEMNITKNTNAESAKNSEESILSSTNYFLEKSLNNLVDNISNYFEKIISTEINDIIFIYTDIIKPRHVGNKKTKCLKVFSISSLKNYLNFNRVEYFPLETFNINDVSIMIRNDEGKELNLLPSIPVYCTLHFKKI